MGKGAMSREQFLEKLDEVLGSVKEKGFDADVTQGSDPWSVSVSIGKEGASPHIVDVTMYTHVVKGYEVGFESEVAFGVDLWPELVRGARNGAFDEGLFLDMASFAFEDLVKGASGETVSRKDAYLAHVIKEFADVDADISGEFAAAQLVAEALSAQACSGWQRVDGEVPDDKLVVFNEAGDRILVDMAPCDLSPLLDGQRP